MPHPPKREGPQDPTARSNPQLTWIKHIRCIVGKGLPPLTGKAQRVLLCGAFGKRGVQAGGAPGHSVLPIGKPSPHWLLVPTAVETGLGQDHHICELPVPLSEAHPSCKYPMFTFPEKQGHSVSRVSHSRAGARARLTRTGGKVADSGLCGSAGIAAGSRSLLVSAAAAPVAGRPGAPLLLGFTVWVE